VAEAGAGCDEVMRDRRSDISEAQAMLVYRHHRSTYFTLVFNPFTGKEQSNATTFSSVDSQVVPLVERQAYILPLDIVALEETITTKGITSKHPLVATTDSQISQSITYDAHTPAPLTPANLLPPYIPELPYPHESILHYKEKVEAIRGTVISPIALALIPM